MASATFEEHPTDPDKMIMRKPRLDQGEEHMTHELIAKLTEMLEVQTKLTETAVDMLKPAIDAAYQKGYADAMGWKIQNHLEHLPPQEKNT